MRILVVHPGADTSTSDVHTGLVSGLRRRGDVALDVYELGGRFAAQSAFVEWLYRKERKRLGPSVPTPTPTDKVKRASYALPDAIWRHQADWLLIVSGMFLHPDVLGTLRWFGRPRIAMLLTESPYDDEQQAKLVPFCHWAWTNELASVERLKALNPNVSYLRHAFNPTVHHPAPQDDTVPRHDVVFVGTGFSERIELLSAIDWDGMGIDLGLYGNWEYLGPRHHLRKYVREHQIGNDRAVALYRNAKVGLNLYRSSLGWGRDAKRLPAGVAQSLNPRAYELAACGCFTISDYRPEVSAVFGDLVPTFRNPKELAAMLVGWLADDDGRQRVAQQLPQAVRHETWDRRVDQILAELQQVTG